MSDDETQTIVDAVADVTRSRLGHMSRAELDQGWDRLDRALTQGRCPKVPVLSTARRWWVPCLALGAAGLLVLTFGYLRPERQAAGLRYAIEGATVGPGGAIQTSPEQTARVLFSDSSQIRVAPSTRVSVASTNPHGSSIALAYGDLEVDIRHLPSASWRLEAGPFSVKVVGTAFHLGFDARRGRLKLSMHSGRVEVSGPTSDRVTTLRAGESIELSAEPTAEIAGSSATGTLARPPATPTIAPAVEEPRPVLTAPSLHRRTRPEQREATPEAGPWPRLIASGEFAAVVKDAEARGLERVLAGSSAADLNALADAARYTRRDDLARRALLGLRARFAHTQPASDAAFFLGRLSEGSPAATAAAVRWYDDYLAEAPRGPYAREAMGRELALLARWDRARARATAATYLERFPQGPGAELARSLLAPAP
jgi:hypothetical protein